MAAQDQDSSSKMDETSPLLKKGTPPTLPSSPETEQPVAPAGDSNLSPYESKSIQRIVRKFDKRLLPILFITFTFNFLDKSTLSSSAVFGLTDDVDLSGNNYSWVASIFYVGYLVWEYPAAMLIHKFPVGKYVGITLIIWGFLVGATSAGQTFWQLMIVRFLLGAVEAAVSPSFLYIIAMWYSRDEIPSRMGVWYSGNSSGGAVGHVFSWAIGHVDYKISPWRWMFLIVGVLSTFWGFFVLRSLPDDIVTAKFLTDDEKQQAETRVSAVSAGILPSSKSEWNRSEALDCLLDPKTWFIFFIAFLNQLPNGGFQSFSNLIIEGFGFSALESSLTSLPISFSTIAIILGTGWFATKYQNTSTILISSLLIPPILGFLFINRIDNRILNLFLYYTISFSHAVLPLISSLLAANIRSVTQKTTMTALMLIAFCFGNIIGPQLFSEYDAPRYRMAFNFISLSFALACLSSLGLRLYLQTKNRNWDEEELFLPREHFTEQVGTEGTPAEDSPVAKGFRYRL